MKLSKSQQKWSTYDKELLAMYISFNRFRHMLEGRDFIIYTDQKPLVTDVCHISGTRNTVADALSRIEVNQISNSFLDFEALSKAQLEDNKLQSFQNDEKSSHVFKRVPSPISATELICDTSTGSPRPFLPFNSRRTIFEHFHNLAHPGVAASFQLIASRYVWPNMRKTVKDWVQNCIACQHSKLHRHTKTPLGTFALPDARFSHIHWPEAVAIENITEETVSHAIFDTWISRFGCPVYLTSDQGRQFEAALFKELTKFLGTNRIRTTSYHPQANGLVERLHRVLKSALMAHENIKWTETLPSLLGLRVAVKPDINASSAAEICTDTSSMPLDYGFVQQLKNQMNNLKPLSTSTHGFSKIFVHPKLDDCTHVFLRVDKVSPSLFQPYTGPHEVLSRNDKHITSNINGKKSCVSLDRVKLAFVFKDLPNTIPECRIISAESSHRHPVTTNLLTSKSASTSIACKPGQRQTYSPILKAQLSAPPRSGVTSPPLKRSSKNVSNGRKCISPVPSSSQNSVSTAQASTSTAGSSTLIKSLLANKVQQRNLQRQVSPQNVSKMVIYSPDKTSLPNQGAVGSSNTMMRCIRPGGLSQLNIRPPVQARFVANKGSLISHTSPRVIKSAALLSPKVTKHTAASTPRLNGIQKDVQMEVFSQDEDSKSNDATYTQVMQMNCLQNHINSDSSFDTKDSISCDGDSVLSYKEADLNSESEKNFLFSQFQENSLTYRLVGSNELSSGNLIVMKSKPLSSDGLSAPKEQQNGSNVTFVNNINSVENTSLSSPPIVQPKINSPSNILKPVLNDLSAEEGDVSKLQMQQKDKISKKAPLLNGLLDKEKSILPVEVQSNPLMQNGNISNPPFELSSDESKSSMSPVQSTTNQCVKSVNSVVPISLNSSVAPVSLNSSVAPVSLDSSVIPVSSSMSLSNSTVVSSTLSSSSTSSFNSTVTYVSNVNSSTSSNSVLNSAVLPATNFNSDEDNLMQICSGQTTLSGTIEVQPDQKGVVRLHIESPENSNQGSDLSSITDIARTLECASQAISRTNAECNTQVPYCGTCETTATVTVITTNTSTLARTGQQIIVVTPALNQPQLHIQSPNIKFRILHSLPRSEETVDLLPHVNANQMSNIRQPAPETPSISTATLKRPSIDTSSATDAKRTRIDTKTPLLEATLRLPSPVPCSVASCSNVKSFQENQSFLRNSQIENLSSPKLTSAKAVPVQNVDYPNEREVKTFSGLSSASDNPSLSAPPQVPPKSMSSTKLEYTCEWKDCGLKFPNPRSVFMHASKVHTPYCNDDMICQWEGCDSMKRRRFSLLTHLQDWHCNERVLHIQALRRKQLSQQGKTSIAPPQMPPPHPGYAPDAAFLAIRRHALQYINPKELSEEKESALTKSIRLTSALILRNLVTHSSLARTYVRRFEPELAYLAMSPVEAARTIAQCLSEISRTQD
ncbi:hypothetical protein TNCV_1128411 [Trichonephila clavipes]|nr:hypothetical protein TNCV_1128411 [Trichonephila clavipes]